MHLVPGIFPSYKYQILIFESISKELNRVAFKNARKKVYLFIGCDFQGILLSYTKRKPKCFFLVIFETNKITFLSKKRKSCFITRVIFGPDNNTAIKFVFNFFLGAPLFSELIRLNAICFEIRAIGVGENMWPNGIRFTDNNGAFDLNESYKFLYVDRKNNNNEHRSNVSRFF